MKKFLKSISIALLVIFSLNVLPGCYGRNVVFTKIHRWNGTISNKFVNSIVHIILWIIPVYEFSLFIDIVILNLIEFWTGSNPLAMAPGEKEEQIVKHDGEIYKITATQNRFDVKQVSGTEAGKKASLVYNSNDKSWYIESGKVKQRVLKHKAGNPNIVDIIYPDGTTEEHELNL